MRAQCTAVDEIRDKPRKPRNLDACARTVHVVAVAVHVPRWGREEQIDGAGVLGASSVSRDAGGGGGRVGDCAARARVRAQARARAWTRTST